MTDDEVPQQNEDPATASMTAQANAAAEPRHGYGGWESGLTPPADNVVVIILFRFGGPWARSALPHKRQRGE